MGPVTDEDKRDLYAAADLFAMPSRVDSFGLGYLEAWLNGLVPENDPLYTHTVEGPDDMPAHIKAALTAVNLSVPLIDGKMALGTWQGIFLWEHRHRRGDRQVVVNVVS